MALPLENRLKLAKDFRMVSRNQLSCKEGKLLLKAAVSKKQVSRFGIVVSKAVAKKAAERNHIRRLLVEAIAANKELLRSSFDIVLVALPGFSLQNQKEANEYIKQLFRKVSLKISS